jgi:hypothetical protein
MCVLYTKFNQKSLKCFRSCNTGMPAQTRSLLHVFILFTSCKEIKPREKKFVTLRPRVISKRMYEVLIVYVFINHRRGNIIKKTCSCASAKRHTLVQWASK